MTALTWTRREGVLLMPRFVGVRKQGYDPAQARALGVSEKGLFVWLYLGVQIAQDDVVTLDRHLWRTPYFTIDMWSELWAENVAAGLAEPVWGGWRITPAGYREVARSNANARAYLGTLALPRAPVQRLAETLGGLAAQIPAHGERAMAARVVAPTLGSNPSAVVRIDQAVLELWAYRDDCHIGAWEAAGYDGPSLDVLSQVWEGCQTIDEILEPLLQRSKQAPKQTRADVQRNAERLVQRGDLVEDHGRYAITPQGRASREAIEAETDRRFFPGWPSGFALRHVWEDLAALIAAAPAPVPEASHVRR